jgi:hypothetical protein
MAIKAGGWTVVQDPTAKRGPYAYKVIFKDYLQSRLRTDAFCGVKPRTYNGPVCAFSRSTVWCIIMLKKYVFLYSATFSDKCVPMYSYSTWGGGQFLTFY